MRYRFKGIVRTTGQPVEGHAHGESTEHAYNALSEHGIVTETLVSDPEPLNLGAASQPLSSAIDSALDTAASQVPFDAVAKQYKGKNVWVLDRDKIRKRVAQVVDQAIRETIGDSGQLGSVDIGDVRKQVSDAISGLFKDNRNLTSQVSNTSMQLEHQIKRIDTIVRRAESVLAQMTVAISRIGAGGGGAMPRRHAFAGEQRNEQNQVLLEIFKENLRLRGISIDEPVMREVGQEEQAAPQQANAESELQPVSTPPESS